MTHDVRGREGVVPFHSRRQRKSYGGGGVWGGWSIFAGTEIKATFTFVGNIQGKSYIPVTFTMFARGLV